MLIEATNLSVRMPSLKPNERALTRNPLRLFGDFYFSRTVQSENALLNDISFTLKPGERLGLIGANGAGKSTLLRVLAGIFPLSSGKLEMKGTARGLFDISLGMLHGATGLENIYLRGLHMGLDLKLIHGLIPEIVAFSELGKHIDKPLSDYSTGMRQRLAIAVSTIIQPDILLLDEWIGTVDQRFSAKVNDRMRSVINSSRGLVLATHNANLMKSLCTHGLVLEKGCTVFHGKVADAQLFYSTEILSK